MEELLFTNNKLNYCKIQQQNMRKTEEEYTIQLLNNLKLTTKLLDKKDKQIDKLVKLVKELQDIIKEKIL